MDSPTVRTKLVAVLAQQDCRGEDSATVTSSFNRLLRWLDGAADSQGRSYETMRQRLIRFFDLKNCPAPEELADETFNRVEKWLADNDRDYDPEPAKICFQTARFVFHEHLRRAGREQSGNAETLASTQFVVDPHETAAREQQRLEQERELECLEHCAQKLAGEDCDLIVAYYYGEQSVKLAARKALAAARGLTNNALRVRACRIREKLRACVLECLYA